jgi:23S rRNA pseudouridine2605 synthase
MENKVRLQKYLAECGIGSRRTCEKYIQQGNIQVNGEVITRLGTKIDPDIDKIYFNNNLVLPEEKKWIMLNKPPKIICSSNDPKKKASFLNLLPNNIGRVFAVGRLDFMSEGLLLVTNDGDLANKIIHPRYEIQKIYEVKTLEEITADKRNQMIKGIYHNSEKLKVLYIKQKQMNTSGYCYDITLCEGKNRHIRRMLAALEIHIISLKRIQIGSLSIGNLRTGEWRYLTDNELKKISILGDKETEKNNKKSYSTQYSM